MTEQIGKVKLDYSHYPGQDFYCDGAVEDELLEIVKRCRKDEYPRIIEEKADWPVLYHLSAQRENIIDWIPFGKTDRVLEIGSGCGAITGALSRKAGSVTCVELSKKRSLVNAYRNRECDNVTIHVGNFKDIEPTLPCDYDYICLIGVFEYGQSYMGTDTPYEDFLKIIQKHLNDKGRLLIAIENKLGMKYFAGCREDHLGSYFTGIENYPGGGGVRTFSRAGLERIFRSAGITRYHFYYPYPDYKFMTSLYSDEYLPKKGELYNNLRNFDRDRMLLFDEKNAFDSVLEDGYFDIFSNSYLAVAGEPFSVKYVKCSNDRAPEYAVHTQILQDKNGKRQVRKLPVTPEANAHIFNMKTAYDGLCERYRGSSLSVNSCVIAQETLPYAEFDYVQGRTLAELLDDCLKREDQAGFERLFRKYVEKISFNPEYPVSDYDLVFSNILVDGDTWTVIDYEWTFAKKTEPRELAFRAFYCYLLEDEKRAKADMGFVLKELHITEEEAQLYKERETAFQKYVTGNGRSLAEMRELIGHPVLRPVAMEAQGAEPARRVQVYLDRGNGYREEDSYFVKDAYKGPGQLSFEVRVESGITGVRIDPAMEPCLVKIREIVWNQETVQLESRKKMTANGRIFKDSEGKTGYPCIVFPTQDPNLNIRLEGMKRQAENVLSVRLEVVSLPFAVAKDLAGAGKKRIFL